MNAFKPTRWPVFMEIPPLHSKPADRIGSFPRLSKEEWDRLVSLAKPGGEFLGMPLMAVPSEELPKGCIAIMADPCNPGGGIYILGNQAEGSWRLKMQPLDRGHFLVNADTWLTGSVIGDGAVTAEIRERMLESKRLPNQRDH